MKFITTFVLGAALFVHGTESQISLLAVNPLQKTGLDHDVRNCDQHEHTQDQSYLGVQPKYNLRIDQTDMYQDKNTIPTVYVGQKTYVVSTNTPYAQSYGEQITPTYVKVSQPTNKFDIDGLFDRKRFTNNLLKQLEDHYYNDFEVKLQNNVMNPQVVSALSSSGVQYPDYYSQYYYPYPSYYYPPYNGGQSSAKTEDQEHIPSAENSSTENTHSNEANAPSTDHTPVQNPSHVDPPSVQIPNVNEPSTSDIGHNIEPTETPNLPSPSEQNEQVQQPNQQSDKQSNDSANGSVISGQGVTNIIMPDTSIKLNQSNITDSMIISNNTTNTTQIKQTPSLQANISTTLPTNSTEIDIEIKDQPINDTILTELPQEVIIQSENVTNLEQIPPFVQQPVQQTNMTEIETIANNSSETIITNPIQATINTTIPIDIVNTTHTIDLEINTTLETNLPIDTNNTQTIINTTQPTVQLPVQQHVQQTPVNNSAETTSNSTNAIDLAQASNITNSTDKSDQIISIDSSILPITNNISIDSTRNQTNTISLVEAIPTINDKLTGIETTTQSTHELFPLLPIPSGQNIIALGDVNKTISI